MNNKILTIVDSTKKKTGIYLLSGILALAVCSGTVFAAKPCDTLLIKKENGIESYSTDGGRTWSKNLPEGVTACAPTGELKIKEENGIKRYSIDGGKTWSKNISAKAVPAEDLLVKTDDGETCSIERHDD